MEICYLLSLIVTRLIVFGDSTVAGDEIFYAVYPIDGLKDLYTEIKYRESASHSHVEEESATTRDDVCKAVVQNAYIFKVYNVKPITAGWNHSEMSLKNCTEGKNASLSMTGPYQLRDALIFKSSWWRKSPSIQTHVFLCVARNHWSGELVEFYISREYRLGNDGQSGRHFRFIFNQKAAREKLVATAIAEEPPQVSAFQPDAKEYKRVKDVLRADAEKENHRAICDLSSAMKFRLCAIILNAKHYRKTATFPALSASAGLTCVKRKLFVFKYKNELTDEDRSFHDWTVKCVATRQMHGIGTLPATYYVSKGLQPDEFFIFKGGRQHELSDHCYV